MYFMIISPEDESNPINILVNSLIEARDRGVDVKVVLENSKLQESRLAYKRLRNGGVDVYFDASGRLLHIKGIAIDGRYVFIGSANWSRAAIESNHEVTYFSDSAEDALAFKEYIEGISVQEEDVFLPEKDGARLPADFLLLADKGPALLKDHAYKQLDLYLLLLKTAQETDSPKLKIDYSLLAEKMGYEAPDDLGKYRHLDHYFHERIRHPLSRLRRRGLIDYEKGEVDLRINQTARPDRPDITIPFEYWDDRYSDKLSMRAKYMYLICLYEAARSARYPFWFRSQRDMSKLYGISDTTISLGLLELEEEGIIEITRDRPTPPDFADRKANVYRMMPIVERR